MRPLMLIIAGISLVACHKENPEVQPINAKQELQTRLNPTVHQLETIDDIKNEYNHVNALLIAKKLDSTVYPYECNEITGEAVYFSKNGVLMAVRHTEADSHYSSVDQYFVKEDRPYFIFKKEVLWSFNGGSADHPATMDKVTEKRIYIINNQPVQCLEKKYVIQSDAKNNPKPENVPNKRLKDCPLKDLQANFEILLKNRTQKGPGSCLK